MDPEPGRPVLCSNLNFNLNVGLEKKITRFLDVSITSMLRLRARSQETPGRAVAGRQAFKEWGVGYLGWHQGNQPFPKNKASGTVSGIRKMPGRVVRPKRLPDDPSQLFTPGISACLSLILLPQHFPLLGEIARLPCQAELLLSCSPLSPSAEPVTRSIVG